MRDPNDEKKKKLENEIRLKTILTEGYYGVNGLKKKKLNKSFNDGHQSNKKNISLYQSSKLLDLSNFALHKNEEGPLAAERIREKNIDRLRLLRKYEDN